MDDDGQVGIGDIADLIDMILSGSATVDDCPAADVDGDGRITIGDVSDLIDQLLGSQHYARLRFGVGNDFPRGAQVDYVLGHPTAEQLAILPERAKLATDAIRAFCLSGIDCAMTHYNNK